MPPYSLLRPAADPSFIHAELIPDSAERNDDKLYFFFRERSAEAPQMPAVYARIGRICLVGLKPLPRWGQGQGAGHIWAPL